MIVIKQFANHSRPDAVRLTRTEKMAMILLAHAATSLDDLQTELADRLVTVENGPDRLKEISRKTDQLLNDLRETVPENQRIHLQNTAMDYEMRLAPKAQPNTTNVIMEKEEFRGLVDCARARCRECTEDDSTCTECTLYNLLTSVLPLEDYHDGMLCPYNLAAWGN